MNPPPREAQEALAATWERILKRRNPDLVGLRVRIVDERPGSLAAPTRDGKRDALAAPHDTQPGLNRAA